MGRFLSPLIRRPTFPDGIDKVNQLALHRTQRTEVVLAFPQLLFVIALQVRIVAEGDEGGIEKYLPQIAIAALGNISLSLYGGAAFKDAAVQTDKGDELLRCGKTVDVTDKCH